jgi:hypothetical protein
VGLAGFAVFQRRHAYHRGLWDLSPFTAAGKVFTILYIFVGLGIVLGFVNAVAERSLERRSEARERRRREAGQQGDRE